MRLSKRLLYLTLNVNIARMHVQSVLAIKINNKKKKTRNKKIQALYAHHKDKSFDYMLKKKSWIQKYK